MIDIMPKSFGFFLAVSIGGSAAAHEDPKVLPKESSSLSIEDDSDACRFPLSTRLGKRSCGVSIFALASDPDSYSGKRVTTLSFLEVQDEAQDYFIAAPSMLALKASDLYSCVRIVASGSYIVASGSNVSRVQPGVYAVEISGLFTSHSSSWCVGKIEEAEIIVRWKEQG